MGGNVGLYNPYYELTQLPPEPQPSPVLMPYGEESPMYVNGQQVRATMDGMPVPLMIALNSLQNGSAVIDFRNTDRLLLSQMGIYTVYVPGHTENYEPGKDTDDVIRIGTQKDIPGRWEYFFGNVNWQPTQQQRRTMPPQIPAEKAIDLGGGPTPRSNNPNCFLNAVSPYSPGIARGFDGHDGYHARGPGDVIALPAMAGGIVEKVTSGGSGAAFDGIVDISLPDGKHVLLLKDLNNISVKKGGPPLKAGQKIGIVRGGYQDWLSMLDGLHFAIIRAEYYAEYRRLTQGAYPGSIQGIRASAAIKQNFNKWFVDPLSAESPFNCPGITTRINDRDSNGLPMVYPIQ